MAQTKKKGQTKTASKKTVKKTAAQKAVKTAPKAAPLDLGALELLLDEGRPSEALRVLAAAPDKDAFAWFLTAEAQRQLGSFEDALKSYAVALQLADEAELRMDILLAMASC